MYERGNSEIAHGTRVVPAGHQRDSRHVRSACDVGDLLDGSVRALDAERRREITAPDEERVIPLTAAIASKCASAA